MKKGKHEYHKIKTMHIAVILRTYFCLTKVFFFFLILNNCYEFLSYHVLICKVSINQNDNGKILPLMNRHSSNPGCFVQVNLFFTPYEQNKDLDDQQKFW